MRILDLFAGIGGFSLAGHWAGHDTVAFVEKDPFCQQVLKKNFAGVPIYGDIKEFDGTKYKGTVDIICGGFPCQPFSVAGKRKGIDDDRHLWPQMLRVIREVKPTWVIGENVGGFLTIGEGLVFEQTCLDLEAEGYEVQAFVIPAVAVNAPHRRDRVWIVARLNSICGDSSGNTRRRSGSGFENGYSEHQQGSSPNYDNKWELQQKGNECDKRGRISHSNIKIIADSPVQGRERGSDKNVGRPRQSDRDGNYKGWNWNSNWIEVATALCRMDDGLPVRMDGFELSKSGHRRERLKSLGNSIVPQVAYEIFKAINEDSI